MLYHLLSAWVVQIVKILTMVEDSLIGNIIEYRPGMPGERIQDRATKHRACKTRSLRDVAGVRSARGSFDCEEGISARSF